MLTSPTNKAAAIFSIGALTVCPSFSIFYAIDSSLAPRFMLLSFILLITTGLLLWKKELANFKQFNSIGVLLLLFYLLNLSTVLWSNSFAESIFESQKMLLWFGVFFNAVVFYQTYPSFKKWAFKSSIVLTFIGGAIALIQMAQLPTVNAHTLYNINAICGHKNLFSSLLFLLLMFSLQGVLYLQNTWRKLAVFSTMLLFSFIVVLQTRAVWLGFFFTLFTFGVLFFWKFRQIIPKKTLAKIAIAVGLLLGGIVTFYVVKGDYQEFVKRFYVPRYNRSETAQERITLWNKTACLIKKHPLTGVGAGQWKTHYGECSIAGLYRIELHNVQFQRPHNDFLWVFAETGILGFVVYILIFVWLIIASIAYLKKETNNKKALSISIYLSFLLGYLLIAAFDFPKERIEHLIYTALLLAFLSSELTSAGYLKAIKFPKWVNLGVGAMLVALILNVVIGGYRIKGEYYTAYMITAKHQQKWNALIHYAHKAQSVFYQLDPTAAPLNWYIGTAYFTLGNADAAITNFKQAYQYSPYSQHITNDLASCYEVKGQHEKAKSLYQESIRISPTFEDPRLNLGAIYYNEKNYTEALKWVESVTEDLPRKKQYLETIKKKLKKQ